MFKEDYKGWPKDYKEAIKTKAETFCVSEEFDTSKLKSKNKQKRDEQIKIKKREIYDERFKQEKLKFCSKHLGLIGMEDITGPVVGMINICRYKDKKAKEQEKEKGKLLSKLYSELIFKTYTGKDAPAKKSPGKAPAKKSPVKAPAEPKTAGKAKKGGAEKSSSTQKAPEKSKEGEKILKRIREIATIVFKDDKNPGKKGSLLKAAQIKAIKPDQISCDKGPKIQRTLFGRDQELIDTRREERRKERKISGRKRMGVGPRHGGIVGDAKKTAKKQANKNAVDQREKIDNSTKAKKKDLQDKINKKQEEINKTLGKRVASIPGTRHGGIKEK